MLGCTFGLLGYLLSHRTVGIQDTYPNVSCDASQNTVGSSMRLQERIIQTPGLSRRLEARKLGSAALWQGLLDRSKPALIVLGSAAHRNANAHHADNCSSVLASHPRDHNCSAVDIVIPNMPTQLHSGASIRVVPRIPFLQDHGELLQLLLRRRWTLLRVHFWHDMFEHPDLVPRSLRPASL